MTIVDTTTRGQGDTLSFEFDLPHPPQRVWRALTDPTLVAQWLLQVDGLGIEPGTEFTFQAPPQPGWDGTVHCRTLAVDEPRAHDSLGLLRLREGRHADAVRAFEQALARDPRFDESRVNLELARAARADAEGLRPADTTEGGA